MRFLLLISLFCFRAAFSDAVAYNVTQSVTQGLNFYQKLGDSLPKDAAFIDHNGKDVTIANYLGNGPVVVAMAYYNCPNICTVVFRETFQALQALRMTSKEDFTLLFIGIDPKENWDLAASKRRSYLSSYKTMGFNNKVHFLVGKETEIKKVADSIGFQYRFDAHTNQYIHPAGITVVTPKGVIARYLLGMRYEPTDLRLALVEASEGKIGSPIDKVILFCYKYDPALGKYGFAIMSALRVFGGFTVAALLVFIFTMIRRERRKQLSEGI